MRLRYLKTVQNLANMQLLPIKPIGLNQRSKTQQVSQAAVNNIRIDSLQIIEQNQTFNKERIDSMINLSWFNASNVFKQEVVDAKQILKFQYLVQQSINGLNESAEKIGILEEQLKNIEKRLLYERQKSQIVRQCYAVK